MSEKLILTSVELDELCEEVAKRVIDKITPLLKEVGQVGPEEQVYLKPTKAGKLIDHGPDFIRKLVKEGHLSAHYPGSDLTISKKELLEYMQKRMIPKVGKKRK